MEHKHFGPSKPIKDSNRTSPHSTRRALSLTQTPFVFPPPLLLFPPLPSASLPHPLVSLPPTLSPSFVFAPSLALVFVIATPFVFPPPLLLFPPLPPALCPPTPPPPPPPLSPPSPAPTHSPSFCYRCQPRSGTRHSATRHSDSDGRHSKNGDSEKGFTGNGSADGQGFELPDPPSRFDASVAWRQIQHRTADSCWSQQERHLYHTANPSPPSAAFRDAVEEFEAMQRECVGFRKVDSWQWVKVKATWYDGGTWCEKGTWCDGGTWCEKGTWCDGGTWCEKGTWCDGGTWCEKGTWCDGGTWCEKGTWCDGGTWCEEGAWCDGGTWCEKGTGCDGGTWCEKGTGCEKGPPWPSSPSLSVCFCTFHLPDIHSVLIVPIS
ncbi:unnamed protein product [Closterium sp. Naga37s-1]|nr:unnamed protein product [Closterium sp. Naga37s-1]